MKNDFKSIWRNLKKSWMFIKDEKKYLILFLVFSLCLSAVSIITPLLSAQMLIYLTDGLFENLLVIALVVFAVGIMNNIFGYLYNILFHKYSLKTISKIQVKIAEETMKLEVSELDSQSSGVFIDRVNNDTREIINIFSDLGDGIIDVIGNIGVLVAIFLSIK